MRWIHETGRCYQEALGISNERILLENGDIADADLGEVDLVYLYRPVRPQGDGELLYRIIAQKLAESGRFVTIVSMADRMGHFLDESFKNISSNKFVEIYRLPRSGH